MKLPFQLFLFTTLVLLFSLPSDAWLGQIYVSPNATEGSGDGSYSKPFASFLEAVSPNPGLLLENDIFAFPGVYSGENNYNLPLSEDVFSFSFYVEGAGSVVIDFEGTNNSFFRTPQRRVSKEFYFYKVEGFQFVNQGESTVPILSVENHLTELILNQCVFQDLSFAVSCVRSAIKVSGSTFQNITNPNQNGPALFLQECEAQISSSSFETNHGLNGGALYATSPNRDSNIILESTHFVNNVAEIDGGAVYFGSLTSPSVFEKSASFQNNTALQGSGGGVFSESGLYFHENESQILFQNNQANEGKGGGLAIVVSVHWLPSNLSGVKISKNTASFGGGVYLSSSSAVDITSSSISNNSALFSDLQESGGGGGVFFDSLMGNISIQNTIIDQNFANGNGGGVYIAPSASTNLVIGQGCEVTSNIAEGTGGGIELGGSVFLATFMSADITANLAKEGGGGMMLRGPATVDSCEIKHNEGGFGGGVGIDEAGFVILSNNFILENTAHHEGGGIHLTNFSHLQVLGGGLTGNSAPIGGGAYIENSLPVLFYGVDFQTFESSNEKLGSSLYLIGPEPDLLGQKSNVSVTLKLCNFDDPSPTGIVCDRGQHLWATQTCQLSGMVVVGDSFFHYCGCSHPAKTISNFFLSGHFFTDSNVSLTTFYWPTGILGAVGANDCAFSYLEKEKKTDFETGFVTITLSGSAAIGAESAEISSKGVNWVVRKDLHLHGKSFFAQNCMISNFGTIHLAEFELICEGFIQNSGIFEMSANSTVSANLVHAEGNMSTTVNLTPFPTGADAPYVTDQEIKGGALTVNALSLTPLLKGDTFSVLKWGANNGVFDTIIFVGSTENGAHADFSYTETGIECEIVGDSDFSEKQQNEATIT